ncbi:MAG TPA: hypothetical protein VKV26_06350 [Dehalococcoidia bacterium]|nr:hypothetical protein [Dehalococcoidia bacterium]
MSEDAAASRYHAIGAALGGGDGPVTAGKAFGMPCLKLNGKLFAGFYQGEMVFKLAGAEHRAALDLPGATLFEPMAGRPMRAWVQVPYAHEAAWPELAEQALRTLAAEAPAPAPKRPARARRGRPA